MDIKDKTLVIGVGYKARQGKGTVVSAMADYSRSLYDTRVYGFGDVLKEEVNEMDQFEACMKCGVEYDFNPDMTDPLSQTKHGKQSRLLQYVGELRRKQDSFYWVKRVIEKIVNDKPRVAIIHDLRYKNEYALVKALGGYTVKVTRTGFIDLSRDPKHISEVDLDTTEFDFDINVADGNIEELKNDAIVVFKTIEFQVTPQMKEIEEDASIALATV